MKIKFIKYFPSNIVDIKIGEIHEVINKKEADKWNNYIRYQIKTELSIINIPEMFVKEINWERSHRSFLFIFKKLKGELENG